jgi:hypothetical protein
MITLLQGREVGAVTGHGLCLDRHGRPICPHCGTLTNSAYAAHQFLACWQCGRWHTTSPPPVPTRWCRPALVNLSGRPLQSGRTQ